MPTPAKEQTLRELAEQFRDARGVVLADFTGLSVEQATELRRRCRQANVRYLVVKNRLARLAIQGTALEPISSALRGPTGVAWAVHDPVAPARVITAFEKEFGKPKPKGGWVEGTVVRADEVAALASLPGRQELLAQVTGAIGAPLTSFVGTLAGLLGQLTGLLEAIREKRQAAQS